MSQRILRATRAAARVMVDDARPIGSGGEAAVYAVDGDPSRVVKLYHAGGATADRHAKLRLMLDHPPRGNGASGVAWPLDEMVDASGRFCGFVMPRVSSALLLHELADPKDRLRRAPRVTPDFLIGVVRNLAKAVASVHEVGHLIGDLNANNVCISRTGLVTIVDTDSFEIRGAGVRYACRTGMLELQAPEITRELAMPGKNFANVTRTQGSDNWILALLCYSLLTDGEDATSALHTQAQPGFLGMHTLAEPLSQLIRRTLASAPPQRPTAREWADAAHRSMALLVPCTSKGDRHRHPRHLRTCPYCERATVLGIDTFAGVAAPAARQATPLAVPRPMAPAPTIRARTVPTSQRQPKWGWRHALFACAHSPLGVSHSRRRRCASPNHRSCKRQ